MCSVKYKIGQTIIKCKPFVHSLKNEKKKILCDHCFEQIGDHSSDKSIVKCEECLHMFYCSHRCKDNDSGVHRLECLILSKDYQYLEHHFFRLLLRSYLMIINDNKSRRRLRSYRTGVDSSGRTFDDLMTNSQQIKSDAERMQIFEYCWDTFDYNMDFLFNLDVDKELLFEIFCKLVSNHIEITGFSDGHKPEVLGLGLYIEKACIGHSCAPNSAPIFDGSQLIVKAIKSIVAGEELTMNYCPLDISRDKRQEILRNVFYKECQCLRCLFNDFDIDYKNIDSIRDKIRSHLQNENCDWSELSRLCDQWIEYCRLMYGHFHPQTIVYMLRVASLKIQDKTINKRQLIAFMSKVNFKIGRIYGQNHCLNNVLKQCLDRKLILDFE